MVEVTHEKANEVMQLESTHEVRCIHRAYSRTYEGGQLEEIKTRLRSKYRAVILFSEGKNIYWPIAPADVDDLRKRGILLTEKGQDLCAVVQEVSCHIPVDSYENAVEIVHDLLTAFPGTFSNLSVVTEWLTEIQAV
tara:strand:- start:2527 stop:2937 length:411 start_codon:yes stop_codon:yes gene_type:complete